MVTRIFGLLLLTMPLMAGNIYGTLRFGDGRVLNGIRVEIFHPHMGETTGTTTGDDGSYRLFVRPNGRCRITVFLGGEPVVGEVFSYADPVKYDFDLVNAGGRLILRRR